MACAQEAAQQVLQDADKIEDPVLRQQVHSQRTYTQHPPVLSVRRITYSAKQRFPLRYSLNAPAQTRYADFDVDLPEV